MKTSFVLRNHWIILISILGFISLGFFSCNEKTATDPATVPSGKTDGGENPIKPGTGEGLDVCDELNDESKLKNFDDLVDMLCDSDKNDIDDLRGNYYTGSKASSKYNLDAKEKSDITEFTMSNAMKIEISAADYFELMELKFKDPDEFDDQGYKVGDGVDYVVIDDDNPVKFSYKNTKYQFDSPASLIEYEATTDFITIEKGSLYAIATKMTKDIDTIKTLEGLIVIHTLGDGEAEIISVSTQSMDNGGEHETSVSRMKESTTTELELSFENAEKKGKK